MKSKTKDVTPGPEASGAADPATQYGALCWRRMGDKVEVLLVTSRDTGRWIIPKGWPMKGRSPSGAARQEAFEEAGVEGRIAKRSVGRYAYDKVLGPDRSAKRPCVVSVYPLQVRKVLDSFPERSERRRKWFRPKKAAQKVDEPELQALLRAFEPPAGEKDKVGNGAGNKAAGKHGGKGRTGDKAKAKAEKKAAGKAGNKTGNMAGPGASGG